MAFLNEQRAWRLNVACVAGALALSVGSLLTSCSVGANQPTSSVDERLSELLGVPISSEQAASDAERLHSEGEALVGECMAEHGFAYLPIPSQLPTKTPSHERDGYGVATGFLAFVEGTSSLEPLSGLADPNQPTLAELTPQERAQWLEALNGQEVDAAEASDAAQRFLDPEGSGCRGQARRALPQARGTELLEVYNEHMAGVNSDPRVAAALAKWPSCMASEGYQFQTALEARQHVDELMNEFGAQILTAPMNDSGVPELSQSQMSQLVRIADMERAIAAFDLLCSEEVTTVRAQVALEFQEAFLSDRG